MFFNHFWKTCFIWCLNYTTRFSVIFPPTIRNFMEGEGDEIKSRQASQIFLTLYPTCYNFVVFSKNYWFFVSLFWFQSLNVGTDFLWCLDMKALEHISHVCPFTGFACSMTSKHLVGLVHLFHFMLWKEMARLVLVTNWLL